MRSHLVHLLAFYCCACNGASLPSRENSPGVVGQPEPGGTASVAGNDGASTGSSSGGSASGTDSSTIVRGSAGNPDSWPVEIPGAPAANKVYVDGLILRPETLTRWFRNHYGADTDASFHDLVDELFEHIAPLGVRHVYIETRAVDTDIPAMRGALYLPVHGAATYRNDTDDFSDAALMEYLIERAHAAGILACAWHPTFNNASLWQTNWTYRAQPESNGTTEFFVSPAHASVRNEEKRIVRDFMNRFAFDCLTLDYIRFSTEEQDVSDAAAAAYTAEYGSSIFQDSSRSSNKFWDFVRFRADLLASFVGEVKVELAAIRDLELGAFLMPHSAKVGLQDAHLCHQRWGYPCEPWSGVDYLKMLHLGLMVSPMVYYQYSDWRWPWDSWTTFVDKVVSNLDAWATETPSLVIPTFSAHAPHDELVEVFRIAASRQTHAVNMFYWGSWVSRPIDKVRAAVEELNGESLATRPRVEITVKGYQASEAMLTFDVALWKGADAVRDVFYRIDGGAYIRLPGEERFTALVQLPARIGAGQHTLSVFVRDVIGRPAQDVAVFEVP